MPFLVFFGKLDTIPPLQQNSTNTCVRFLYFFFSIGSLQLFMKTLIQHVLARDRVLPIWTTF